MVRLRVRVDCRDCTGTDPMGCFNGGSAWLVADERSGYVAEEDARNAAEFRSISDAEKAWECVADGAPWDGHVEQWTGQAWIETKAGVLAATVGQRS